MRALPGLPSQGGVILTLVPISLLAWFFVVWSVLSMDQPLVKLTMPMTASWSLAQVFWVWTMWTVMMAAMMLPSAAPMILLHQNFSRQKNRDHESVWFMLAYLLIWSFFCCAATLIQWLLQSSGVLSHMLVVKSTWIAGGTLIAVGAVQWAPWKQACLEKCRTPIGFLLTEWRPGRGGAMVMGLRHGGYCVGCCWAAMALLFVFGVMNLLAITLLAAFVAAEKLLPNGGRVGKVVGVVLIVWGMLLFSA